jgi:hypothetical protein
MEKIILSLILWSDVFILNQVVMRQASSKGKKAAIGLNLPQQKVTPY